MMNIDARNQDIYRLKVVEGWTHQKVASRYGISRQRVCQILNVLGYFRNGSTLNRRKEQVYNYIITHKLTHDGCAPSAHEIRDGCSMIGTWDQARAHVMRLISEGRLKKSKQSMRTLEVVGGKWTPPQAG